MSPNDVPEEFFEARDEDEDRAAVEAPPIAPAIGGGVNPMPVLTTVQRPDPDDDEAAQAAEATEAEEEALAEEPIRLDEDGSARS